MGKHGQQLVVFALYCAACSADVRQAPETVVTDDAGPSTIEPIALPNQQICDARAYVSERKRLDLYMMVDDSGSMVPWWLPTLDALGTFFHAPEAVGTGVGLGFFGSSCDAASYAEPRVAIAPLPTHTPTLERAFPPLPVEDTATLPALQGAIQHARAWAVAHDDAQAAVVLVTDGLPDACGSTVDNVVEAARAGYEGTPSIRTFVVGIGAISALHAFAAAGGTREAVLVQPGAADDLSRALERVRNVALPCDYALPAGSGARLQASQVNLRHSALDGTQTVIGAVADRASCDPTRGGWYFDSSAAPTRVIACAQSCERMNAGGGEVKVLLGCPTIVVSPD